MAQRSILILHGWQGSGPEHWQSWLADRLRDAGHDVRYPRLPDCDHPCPDLWGAALRDHLRALQGGERVVICHSLAWREARGLPAELRVQRCLLVAPPCPSAGVQELVRFYPTGAQRDAIQLAATTTRLVCSDADPYCPDGAARHWGEPLALAVDVLPGAGHVNADAGFGPWPEVEQWALGRRTSVAARSAPAPAVAGAQSGGAKNGVET